MTEEQGSSGHASAEGGPADCWLGVGMSVMATAGFWLITRAHSWFFSDDYIALSLARVRSFSDFLMTPIDVHFLPLHRLATWLTYTLFPLNFDVALFVMCAFHVAGTWMLYRTLRLVGDSSLNGPLVALSGTNFYAGALLPWWTVGIARFPYLFFSLAAIYHYLRFRQDGSLTRVVVVLGCLVSAAAFYTKALLIPGFLAALELALLPGTPRLKVARNVGVVVITAIAAIAYYRIGIAYGIDEVRVPEFDWALQKAALAMIAVKIPQSVLGLLPSQPLSVANWVAVAVWAAFFCVSVWRDRFNAVVWILAAGVLLTNFLVITLSQRMVLGPWIVTNDRYYFELVFLIALFVAIICKRMRIGEWLTEPRRRRVAIAAVWLATGLLAIASQARLVDALTSPRYGHFRAARDFGRNLTVSIAELRRTHQEMPYFADGDVPLAVLGMAAMEVRRYWEILPIFGPDLVVARNGPCLYKVQDDGTIHPPGGGCP